MVNEIRLCPVCRDGSDAPQHNTRACQGREDKEHVFGRRPRIMSGLWSTRSHLLEDTVETRLPIGPLVGHSTPFNRSPLSFKHRGQCLATLQRVSMRRHGYYFHLLLWDPARSILVWIRDSLLSPGPKASPRLKAQAHLHASSFFLLLPVEL